MKIIGNEKSPTRLLGATGFYLNQTRKEDFSAYNLSVDFKPGVVPKDQISKQPMQTTGLAAGRVSYDGGPYGVNVPAIDENGLFGCGAYENLIKWSEDFTASVWGKGGITTTPNATTAPDGTLTADKLLVSGEYQKVLQEVTLNGSSDYVLSFWVKDVDLIYARCVVYEISSSSSIVNYQYISQISTDHWTLIVIPFTVNLGGSILIQPIRDPCDGCSFYLWGVQLTESSYQLPYIKTESTTVAVPENYSDADQGYKFPIASMPQLLDALDGVADGDEEFDGSVILGDGWVDNEDGSYTCNTTTNAALFFTNIIPDIGDRAEITFNIDEISGIIATYYGSTGLSPSYTANTVGPFRGRSVATGTATPRVFALGTTTVTISNISVKQVSPAKGKLTCEWRPMFDSGDLTGIINIMTANDEAGSFLFFDADNNLLKLTDGTNTSQVACSPVADTVYEITGQWDETNGMVISLDGSAGTTVSFAGSIPNTDDLSYCWEAEAPQYVKITHIAKESGL